MNALSLSFAAGVSYATDQGPTAVALGDLDGDGKLDLAVADEFSDDVSVLLGKGDGTFQAAVDVPVAGGSVPSWVVIADWNGDGTLDLAVTGYGNDTASVLLGKGKAAFAAPVVLKTGFSPFSHP